MTTASGPRPRPVWFALALLPVVFAAPITPVRTVVPYDSDEHRMIGDLGAAMVNIPAGLNLPDGITFDARDAAYVGSAQQAKLLAVGFTTNDASDSWALRHKNTQDNSYWDLFSQRAYNWKIRTQNDQLPAKVLAINAWSSAGAGQPFTFGELVSIYGDYRRTVNCDADGKCYLTHENVGYLSFGKGVTHDYRPVRSENGVLEEDGRIATTAYLRFVGAGLQPPQGRAANTFKNTVGPRDFGEVAWWGDEMLRIANVNDWHFSKVAVAWYVGLHRRALNEVALAKQNEAQADDAQRAAYKAHWHRALHYEANALHSLTDLFAFGHVVTNRDQSSYGIMKAQHLTDSATYVWMEQSIAMGGGVRAIDGDGSVTLTTGVAAIGGTPAPRDALLISDRGSWARWAYNEHLYHDKFNKSGAWVKNLDGTRFRITGDRSLNDMWDFSQGAAGANEAALAVKTSLQTLFDAFVDIGKGSPSSVDLNFPTPSKYFDALRHIPIYIETDANKYFTGRWALYAKAVADMTIGGQSFPADWERCKIPVLTGKDNFNPPSHSGSCTTF